MYKIKIHILLLLTLLIVNCERHYETENVSRTSYLPQFTFDGGDFVSIAKGTQNLTLPEVSVTENNNPIYNYLEAGKNSINTDVPGVYLVYYAAQNSDGLVNSEYLTVAVRFAEVIDNELSGSYTGGYADITNKIKKIDDDGLYSVDDIFGFPGSPVKGRFVDLGNNELVLLPGDGPFGEYDISSGEYTNQYVTWTIKLIEEPYEGIQIPVYWYKNE